MNRVIVPVDIGVEFLEPRSMPIIGPRTNVPAKGESRRLIFVHSDDATLCTNGELLVSGWAVCAVGVGAVALHLNGEFVGDAVLGLPRPDVAEAYPEFPGPLFRISHATAPGSTRFR